ncbi:MAG: PfkB family carbohydrate kinase [Bradymonadaceae bacterium]
MDEPTITIVGHTTHDWYPDRVRAGGCALYGALTYRQLDASAHLVTGIGEHFECEEVFEGVDATVFRRGRTTSFVNLYPDDGPRVQYVGRRAPSLSANDVPTTHLDTDVLHLAPVLREVELAEWVESTEAELIVAGAQGWMKRAGPTAGAESPALRGLETPRRVEHDVWDVEPALLGALDLLFVSDEDVAGREELFERWCDEVGLIVRTHGRSGASVYVEGEPRTIPAVEVDPVDPTGAGDTFAAAFTAGIAAGSPPVDAGHLGAAAASVVIEGVGPSALEEERGRIERRYRRLQRD